VIICVNHLHIIDVWDDFGVTAKKENTQKIKSFPGDNDNEPGTEKEDKEKEKAGEQEKFDTRNNHAITSQFQLPGKDKFICFNTALNKHPYAEDDIRPPKAA